MNIYTNLNIINSIPYLHLNIIQDLTLILDQCSDEANLNCVQQNNYTIFVNS